VHDAPDSYRSHWATGARAFERNHPHEGEAELLQAIRIYPGDAALLEELGEHYLAAGLNAPAERMLSAALLVDSLRADAAVEAVIAQLRLGRPGSAAALGDSALRRVPRAPALLLATSDAVFALGKPALALTYRRRMVYAFPGNWRYQYVAAEGAARAGRCEEARWRLDRAAALAPRESAPHRLREALGDGATCRVPA
jgi:tetratricopeptide (TPR) repeat protein